MFPNFIFKSLQASLTLLIWLTSSRRSRRSLMFLKALSRECSAFNTEFPVHVHLIMANYQQILFKRYENYHDYQSVHVHDYFIEFHKEEIILCYHCIFNEDKKSFILFYDHWKRENLENLWFTSSNLSIAGLDVLIFCIFLVIHSHGFYQ